MNYQLILYGNKIYKEIKIDKDFDGITIGTHKECQISLKREHFLEDFKIDIKKQGDKYIALCDESICFKSARTGSIGQLLFELTSEDVVSVCYASSDVPFLYLDFSMDFGGTQDNYDHLITIPEGQRIVIGGVSGADIFVPGDAPNGHYFSIELNSNGIYHGIFDKCGNGAAVNGVPVRTQEIRIRNKAFIAFYNAIFYLDGKNIRTSSSLNIQSNFPNVCEDKRLKQDKYPEYVRSARQRYKVPEEKIEVLQPKSPPDEQRRGIFLTVLPLMMSMVIMMGARTMIGGNPRYALFYAAMMVGAILTSIMNYFINKKETKKKKARRIKKYDEYITVKEEQIANSREEEKLVLNKMAVSTEDTLKYIENFDPHLFEKEKIHDDYLNISIGKGTIESQNQIEFKKQEYVETEDELMNYPELLHDKYQYIDDMPISIDLKEKNAIGFIGNRNKLYQMTKNLIISICAQHFYKDVKIILIINKEDAELFSWVRWFKNSMDDGMNRRFIMYDDDSTKKGLEFIYSTLSQRESSRLESSRADDNGHMVLTDFVVFVYRSDETSGHPVNNYISRARNLGFSFIFFEEREELLNKACQQRIFLSDKDYSGYIQNTDDGTRTIGFKYDHISRDDVNRAALKMAGVYVDDVSLESTLTKNITLYELMGIMNAYDLDLKTRWANSKIYETMAAPLGVKSDGSVISLDIHERGHGPHGLVAGTTGSGKSEIVQSYVLSMASLFHPYEVGFIIIDFKGGGMANQFKNLPHLNGAITNIDGKEIDRSLKSIKAELMKRQELFAKYETNRIDEYIKLYKEGVTPTPLPHLVLIVDEFAELKSEQPEFMKELISAARIGRSLGVHLILATQKPAGVVNDQIWSNSRFKLCLKVQDKSDSNEVIKSPLAAEIKEPGRAYLQVGNNEIFELFQSAYSGAPAQMGSIDEKREFRICAVGLDGRRGIIYEQKREKKEGNVTQLDALVERINEYCKENNIAKLPDICLPSLGNIIPFVIDKNEKKTGDVTVPIGIYDDPARQYQGVVSFDLSQDNFFIVGASQYGKTNLLQTIIRGLAEKYDPSEVTVYIMDFASMVLNSFKDLKHVGGVVLPNDEEKLGNLFKVLDKEITKRKQILSSMGLSSFSAYRDAGKKSLPQIVVILDNYLAFKDMYQGYEDEILNLCRDGLSMGVSLIITSMQSTGVGLKLMAAFSKKIALNCNDDSDYALLLGRSRIKPNDTPGRCLLEIDREIYECQTYLCFDAEKEIDRIGQIKDFIAAKNAEHKDFSGSYIPEVPKAFDDAYVNKIYPDFKVGPYEILMGIAYSNTMPKKINIAAQNMICMSGNRHKGKRSYINYMFNTLDKNKANAPVEIYIIDSFERILESQKELEAVKLYTLMPDEMDETITKLSERVDERYQRMMNGDQDFMKDEPLIVIVLNSYDYCQNMMIGNKMLVTYKQLINRGQALKVAVMVTDMPTTSATFTAPEIVKTVYGYKNLFLFEELKAQKIIEPPMAVLRANNKPNKPGDFFFVDSNGIMKTKAPILDLSLADTKQ